MNEIDHGLAAIDVDFRKLDLVMFGWLMGGGDYELSTCLRHLGVDPTLAEYIPSIDAPEWDVPTVWEIANA
jgi:hypothetical protein